MVGNALVHMYAKCGFLTRAEQVLRELPARNVVTWNALLGALVQCEQVEDAVQVFHQLLLEGTEPDQVSFSIVFSACASMPAIVTGKWLHVVILARGLLLDNFLVTSLLSMYGNNGDLENAQKLHDASGKCNVAGWTAMISVCAQKGLCKEAFQLYKQLHLESIIPTKATTMNMLDICAIHPILVKGKRIHACILSGEMLPQVSMGNALINMYIKCGHLKGALFVFKGMQERDVVTWTTMITGQVELGKGVEIHHFCKRMHLQGIISNEVTFINMLEACSHMGLIDEAYYYFVKMDEEHDIAPGIEHYNCMVDLLGRAGRLEEAEIFIYKMPFYSTLLPWLTLLSACRFHMNVEVGKKAAHNLQVLEPENNVADALLANVHVALGQWEEVSNLRLFMKRNSAHTTHGVN